MGNICTVSTIVGMALFWGSFMTLTVCKSEKDRIKQVFSNDLDKVYEKIVIERRNHYLYGLGLGMVFAVGLGYAYPDLYSSRFGRISGFVSVTLFTAVLFYSLMPKSDYMLNHLKTEEENKAWFRMYRTMQSRYLYGLILGALAAIPMANSFCGV